MKLPPHTAGTGWRRVLAWLIFWHWTHLCPRRRDRLPSVREGFWARRLSLLYFWLTDYRRLSFPYRERQEEALRRIRAKGQNA